MRTVTVITFGSVFVVRTVTVFTFGSVFVVRTVTVITEFAARPCCPFGRARGRGEKGRRGDYLCGGLVPASGVEPKNIIICLPRCGGSACADGQVSLG